MSLFKGSREDAPESPEPPKPPADIVPVSPIDLSKRYDLYCSTPSEDRLYEDVRLVGIRTFERKTEFSSGLIGGYIEIEARDGARMLIPHLRMYMICEHGAQPTYKVLRIRKTDRDD
jgi:hypothetical protein